MPISPNKDIAQVVYDLLPEMYRRADSEVIKPYSEPLKRFIQVASVGLKDIEGKSDAMKLLRNADFVDERFLDILGRNFGFEFPSGTTVEEKRRLLKNLPDLYKIKGNSDVFDLLARTLFHKSAKTSVDWRYDDVENSRNVQVTLELGDSAVDNEGLEGKRQRFIKLIEYFRPVNVGTAWTMSMFYDVVVELLNQEEEQIVKVNINDNFNPYDKETSTLNSNDTLGVIGFDVKPFNIYGGNTYPEYFPTDKTVESAFSDLVKLNSDNEVAKFSIRETLDHTLAIIPIEKERAEILTYETFSQDVTIDYSGTMNFGVIGESLILNTIPIATQH